MDEIVPKHPLTEKDYWRVGPVYVRKWVLLGLLAALSMLILAVFGPPTALFSPLVREPPAFRFNDPKLARQSGEVRILDARDVVRYEGEVDQGACTGQGKVYDSSGQLVYHGPLVDGRYEGEDALVYRDGFPVYAGEMANNLYEGQGRRTDPISGIVSEGEFSKGMLSGEGREYYADGALLREGQFSRDLLEGEGSEYAQEGTLLREGTFSAGVLHGVGSQYDRDGALVYEGEFRRGRYHGQGRLYNTSYRTLSYEGEFAYGQPLGLGRIYHPSGQLLYEGQVCDSRPRADAFLGLSLENVEAAFTEHWQLFSCGEMTGFVYPTFRLIFVTESPVSIVSAVQEEEPENGLPQTSRDGETAEESAAVPRISRSSAGGGGDEALSPKTDKKDVIICEVLSYGQLLPGVAQPALDMPSGTRAYGWREWFSDQASNETPEGAVVSKTGQFVYRFTPDARFAAKPVSYYLLADAGVVTTSVLREDKDSSLWYQSARREEAGIP